METIEELNLLNERRIMLRQKERRIDKGRTLSMLLVSPLFLALWSVLIVDSIFKIIEGRYFFIVMLISQSLMFIVWSGSLISNFHRLEKIKKIENLEIIRELQDE